MRKHGLCCRPVSVRLSRWCIVLPSLSVFRQTGNCELFLSPAELGYMPSFPLAFRNYMKCGNLYRGLEKFDNMDNHLAMHNTDIGQTDRQNVGKSNIALRILCMN